MSIRILEKVLANGQFWVPEVGPRLQTTLIRYTNELTDLSMTTPMI